MKNAKLFFSIVVLGISTFALAKNSHCQGGGAGFENSLNIDNMAKYIYVNEVNHYAVDVIIHSAVPGAGKSKILYKTQLEKTDFNSKKNEQNYSSKDGNITMSARLNNEKEILSLSLKSKNLGKKNFWFRSSSCGSN